MSETKKTEKSRLGNGAIVAICCSFVIGMVGAAYAAVPLYEMFCKVTGYGGTTQRVEQASDVILDKKIKVRFDANVSPKLPWKFYPEHPTDTVSIGARDMAIFIAQNNSPHPITGTATFNVTPDQAGKYFTKIQCFCFTQQTLKPGEQIRMPVLFFVDPKIKDDPDARDIQEITLSYTFYPVDEGKKAS